MVIAEGRRLTQSFDENVASPNLFMLPTIYLDPTRDVCFARDPKFPTLFLTFRCPCIISIFLLIYFQKGATLHSLFISGKLLYVFRVVSSPIIRSTHNCIYSIWYLSNRYCYLPLSWKSWNCSAVPTLPR